MSSIDWGETCFNKLIVQLWLWKSKEANIINQAYKISKLIAYYDCLYNHKSSFL